jgi:hypothetical protein
MKIPIWLKQPLSQVLIYLFLYELIFRLLKYNGLIKIDLSLGITLNYLFYLYLFFSFILFLILLIFKNNKLSYSFSLIFIYSLFSILYFGLKSKLIILVLIITTISSLSSYFIFSKKLK